MISYKPFYETLFRKGITEYNLIYKQGFSANTLHRIKQGKHISTKTQLFFFNDKKQIQSQC